MNKEFNLYPWEFGDNMKFTIHDKENLKNYKVFTLTNGSSGSSYPYTGSTATSDREPIYFGESNNLDIDTLINRISDLIDKKMSSALDDMEKRIMSDISELNKRAVFDLIQSHFSEHLREAKEIIVKEAIQNERKGRR